jgi:hypothetical protein
LKNKDPKKIQNNPAKKMEETSMPGQVHFYKNKPADFTAIIYYMSSIYFLISG